MNPRIFHAAKARVLNRGIPPDSFLNTIIEWAHDAKDEIFAINTEPGDVYGFIRGSLGPWRGEPGSKEWFIHRKAVILELMRVHAGFESSWNWKEGVDRNNATSMAHKTGQETGIFQVSFDSEWLNHNAMKPFAVEHDIETPDKFIPAMKTNRDLALEYYARLMRVNAKWAGPVLRHEVDIWLRRDAVQEFIGFLVPAVA